MYYVYSTSVRLKVMICQLLRRSFFNPLKKGSINAIKISI